MEKPVCVYAYASTHPRHECVCVRATRSLFESSNFAKIMHLLWKLRYRNKIIGCKYKWTACNEDICRMRANALAKHFIFRGIKNCTCRSKYMHIIRTAYTHGVRIHCESAFNLNTIYTRTRSVQLRMAANYRRAENMVQYLTALIEKHNLWLQTASCRGCERACVCANVSLMLACALRST